MTRVGTAAPGCPAERSSAAFPRIVPDVDASDVSQMISLNGDFRLGSVQAKLGELSLARTAEGGCPYMVVAGCQVMIAIRSCLPALTFSGNVMGDGAVCVKYGSARI
jgi:hypothetical protein